MKRSFGTLPVIAPAHRRSPRCRSVAQPFGRSTIRDPRTRGDCRDDV